MTNHEGVFPCTISENISLCNLSNLDTMIIELSIGGLIALVFFFVQHRQSKMINLVFKERFDHVVKNSINNLLWMKNGLDKIEISSKDIDKINSIVEINSGLLRDLKDRVEHHNDLPTLSNAIKELAELNRRISKTMNNSRNKEIKHIIKTMNNTIDNLADRYKIKRTGAPPYPLYEITKKERTQVTISKPGIQVIVMLITLGTVIISLKPTVENILEPMLDLIPEHISELFSWIEWIGWITTGIAVLIAILRFTRLIRL